MKNLIVVLVALLPMFAFGQTQLEFLEISDNPYVEKSTYMIPPTPIREISFIGDDNLTPEQNWKVYLAEGEEVLLEKSNAEITYQGFIRTVSHQETSSFLDAQKTVQTNRPNAVQKTGFAWELVVYGLILFIVISLFQKAIAEKANPLVLDLVMASDSIKAIRSMFITLTGVMQALISFRLFPDTEEIFYVWIVSVSLGLSTYYLWRHFEKKKNQKKLLYN